MDRKTIPLLALAAAAASCGLYFAFFKPTEVTVIPDGVVRNASVESQWQNGLLSAGAQASPRTTGDSSPPHINSIKRPIAISRELWATQNMEVFGLDFSLSEVARLALALTDEENRDITELLSRTKELIKKSEFGRMSSEQNGPTATITISPLDKETAAAMQKTFTDDLRQIVGSEKSDFIMTVGKKSMMLAHGNFGSVSRILIFEPNQGAGSGTWKTTVTAPEKISPNGDASGHIVMRSFYMNEVPEGFSHLIEVPR